MSNLRRFQFIYALIDPSCDDMCIGVVDTTNDYSANPNYIPIDEYNEEYVCKYYDRETGKWYLEASHITEWIPT
ncbi:MAG: hypothetical protein ACI4XN_12570 [Candidatus Kurthia intestinigallinarum]